MPFARLQSLVLKHPVPFVGGFVLFVLILLAVFWSRGETLMPWSPNTHLDLPATGTLPSLSEAMKQNPNLRRRVQKLNTYDEAYLFVNYAQVDEDISAILLLWAGADLNDAGRTREGLDKRVDKFLRAIYGFGPDDYIKGDPVMGERPWPRWFSYFKTRLLVQLAAQRVYTQPPQYDLRSGEITVSGSFSRAFMNGFTEFLKLQENPAPYINNFLVFVDETRGLRNLPEEDRMMVEKMVALKEKKAL